MGHGSDPAPLNDLGFPVVIDDGTSARIGAPTPGPVGMDTGNASPQKSQQSMAQKITSFVTQRMGTRHGNGECFTLADDALKNAGAKSAADYSKLTPDTDYVWGTAVAASDVKAGDVIQFRNYRYDRTVETKNPDGSGSADDDFQERPHHTAIVESIDADEGSMTVLEQNAPDGEPVARNVLYFTGSSKKKGKTTTTIKVKGTLRFYRPQAR